MHKYLTASFTTSVMVWGTLLSLPDTAVHAQALPSGTNVEIRLRNSVSSYLSKPGDSVEAILIAPIVQDDEILLPLGAVVHGHVTSIHRVGFGVVRETASIELEFDRVETVGGGSIPLVAKVIEVENSREIVKKNQIQGIRSTGTLSHRTSGAIGNLAFGNPIALIFTTAASASVLRFSNPEIYLPVNTEIILQTTQSIEVTHPSTFSLPAVAANAESEAALHQMLRKAPFRTYTDKTNQPSDMTNLMFIGSRSSIEHAFTEADWVSVASLDAESAYKTVRSIAEDQGYRTAPMSTLLLGNKPPDFALAKTLDTFSKRHHLRIWSTGETFDGQPVWFSSSTHDVGIGFSRDKKTFIHQIDTNVDQERSKVINDLTLTGCVRALNLVDRPWLPKAAKNGTGESLHTDNRIAVIAMNECGSNPAPISTVSAISMQHNGNVAVRASRQTFLTLKNTMLRDNVLATAYAGTKFSIAARKPAVEKHSPEVDSEISSERYLLRDPTWIGSPAPAREESSQLQDSSKRNTKWKEPSVELGVHGGWTGYAGGNGNILGYLLEPPNPADTSYLLVLGNDLDGGWNIGGSVTLDTKNYVSQQINLNFEKSTLNLFFAALDNGVDSDDTTENNFVFDPVGLATMEVGYNVQFHLRPRQSRFRPYAFAGPSLRMMHLSDTPVKKASSWFRLGLSTVGALTAAYQFGSTPPLDGGGIFQAGLQYGGGMTYRVARRWMIRTEYRETFTGQPDFLSASKDDIYSADDAANYSLTLIGPYKEGPMRQQRVTAGIDFVF